MSRRFSSAEHLAVWGAWKAGLTLSQIANGLNRRAVSVLQVLRRDGGFAPRARHRAPQARSRGGFRQVDRYARLPEILAGPLRR
jgi:hypothetical protein